MLVFTPCSFSKPLAYRKSDYTDVPINNTTFLSKELHISQSSYVKFIWWVPGLSWLKPYTEVTESARTNCFFAVEETSYTWILQKQSLQKMEWKYVRIPWILRRPFVWVPQGCHNKMPQTDDLHNRNACLAVVEASCSTARYQQGFCRVLLPRLNMITLFVISSQGIVTSFLSWFALLSTGPGPTIVWI